DAADPAAAADRLGQQARGAAGELDRLQQILARLRVGLQLGVDQDVAGAGDLDVAGVRAVAAFAANADGDAIALDLGRRTRGGDRGRDVEAARAAAAGDALGQQADRLFALDHDQAVLGHGDVAAGVAGAAEAADAEHQRGLLGVDVGLQAAGDADAAVAAPAADRLGRQAARAPAGGEQVGV